MADMTEAANDAVVGAHAFPEEEIAADAVGEAESHPSGPTTATRKKRHRWLRWFIPVMAVVVIGGVVGGVLIYRNAHATTTTTRTITQDYTVANETIATTVSATGTIQPANQYAASFSSAGTVTAVSVAVGDAVTAGQTLATIDTTNLQSAVDSAQAAYNAALTDYNTAVGSYGSSSTQATAANSTLTTKSNALTNANTALANGTLTAPFAGTVAIVSMAVGDSVGSGGGGTGGTGGTSSGSGSSTDSITIITTDTYAVSTSVGASDVQNLKKGMAAKVTPNGSTTAMDGTVASVGVIASSSTSSGATFPVTIDITGTQTGLYAGVSASVVITESSEQVAAVPTQAITMSGGQATVQLKSGSTYTTTPVTTGTVQNGMTAITKGLSVGDVVQVTVTITTGGSRGPNGFSSLLGGGRPTGRPSGFASGQFPSGNYTGGFPGGGQGNGQRPSGTGTN